MVIKALDKEEGKVRGALFCIWRSEEARAWGEGGRGGVARQPAWASQESEAWVRVASPMPGEPLSPGEIGQLVTLEQEVQSPEWGAQKNEAK